jgi:ABC-2 type transport system ATP-binding protein
MTQPSSAGQQPTAVSGEPASRSASAQHKTALVDVQGVGKIYDPLPLWMKLLLRSSISSPVQALSSISFQVQPGEICAVVGPNGAGKSTLFRILTGLTSPTTGAAFIDGLDSNAESTEFRRLVGFAPADDRSLYLRHSCWENLTFHGRLQGIGGKELEQRANEVLELVGLERVKDRVGFALSAGMRARLQIARAMLHRPRVLILDEPTGAVDPMGSRELLEIIVGVVREEGLATLLSSHRLEEIEVLHDHVLLLDGGRQLYWGNLDSLRVLWQRPLIEVSFRSAEAAAEGFRVLQDSGEKDLTWRDAQCIVVGSEDGAGLVLSKLAAQLNDVTGVQKVALGMRELLTEVLLRSSSPGS